MALSRFWLINGRRRKKVSKKNIKNIKVDDEIIKQFKNLIKIYSIGQQTLGDEYFDSAGGDEVIRNTISFLKDTLKILERNKKIEKTKEETKTEFDVWFNSRK